MFENVQKSRVWVEWVHDGNKPAQTQAEKTFYATSFFAVGHCAKCLNLNGCRFMKSKMPEQPLHPNCHCTSKDVPQPVTEISAFAKCPIEKIENYVFINSAKKRFFENNGYSIMDVVYIKDEYERQAAEKYASGEYELGNLDNYGQRITIVIELPRRTGEAFQPLSFETGWMVYPYGIIQLTTPATNLSAKGDR